MIKTSVRLSDAELEVLFQALKAYIPNLSSQEEIYNSFEALRRIEVALRRLQHRPIAGVG